MRQIFSFILLSIALLLAPLASAQAQAESVACDALKQKVQKRLQGKGIEHYTLEWISASTPTKNRVVGRCGKENLKLVYSQHSGAVKQKSEAPEPEASSPHELQPQPKLENTSANIVTKPEPLQPIEKIEQPPKAASTETKVFIPVNPPVQDEKPSSSVQALIQNLRSSNDAFAASMQELTNRPDATTPLITAYYSATYDASFRFNVILVLNQKIKAKKLNSKDLDSVSQCLVDSLKDSSPLVRGEALWGLGLTRNKAFASSVKALLKDPDESVRNEAAITAGLLQ